MKRGRLWIVSVIVLVVVGGGGWQVLHGPRQSEAATKPSPPPPPVPVTVASTRVVDVPVYLDGLGTVQAFNTVQIRAQVNGVLLALPAHEGQEVQKGDVVAEIDPAPYKAALDQAVAQRAEDEAQLQSAELDLQRYASLAKSSYAPVQQVDDQRATVGKETAAIEVDNAMIETAQINLGYCTIRAPFAGRVSLYQVDVGNLIQANGSTGIISIDQDKPIAVVFTLPEAQLTRVQDARRTATLPVIVTDSDTEKPLASGFLMTPNNSIDTTTGTISLKAKFANDDDHLWPGQFIDARLEVETLHDAVTVPGLAVEHGPDGLYVFLVKPDNTVVQTPVQVGYQDNGLTVVTKGLTGHETVVVSGQSRLAPGTKVKTKPAGNPAKAPTAEASDGSASPS
jgi:multidrug efflux system membrane fusion protein